MMARYTRSTGMGFIRLPHARRLESDIREAMNESRSEIEVVHLDKDSDDVAVHSSITESHFDEPASSAGSLIGHLTETMKMIDKRFGPVLFGAGKIPKAEVEDVVRSGYRLLSRNPWPDLLVWERSLGDLHKEVLSRGRVMAASHQMHKSVRGGLPDQLWLELAETISVRLNELYDQISRLDLRRPTPATGGADIGQESAGGDVDEVSRTMSKWGRSRGTYEPSLISRAISRRLSPTIISKVFADDKVQMRELNGLLDEVLDILSGPDLYMNEPQDDEVYKLAKKRGERLIAVSRLDIPMTTQDRVWREIANVIARIARDFGIYHRNLLDRESFEHLEMEEDRHGGSNE